MEAAAEVEEEEGSALQDLVGVGRRCLYQCVRQLMGKHHEGLGAPIAPFLPDAVEGGPHLRLSDGPLKHRGVPDWLVERALNSFAVLPPAF